MEQVPFESLRGRVSIYIHVPFCLSKCPYCAFYSLRPRDGDLEEWTNGVLMEWRLLKDRLDSSVSFHTLYIGGGTPSLLNCHQWERLLNALAQIPREDGAEFTVEVNPESLDPSIFKLWRDGGINRISLGVQSLDDSDLKRLARPHTARQAIRSLEICLEKGFRTSGDLIFALPGQTLRGWHENLSGLIKIGIQHLSIYQLILEPDSFWGKHKPENLPDGYEMYRWSQYYLPHKGLDQYEIASFAVPGQESRHNSVYWTRGPVLALGPSAWGFVEGTRYANCCSLAGWLDHIRQRHLPIDFTERLTGGKAASEAAILALRTSHGIDVASFKKQYGTQPFDELKRRIGQLPENCFFISPTRIALTSRGMRVGNSLWCEMLDL